MLTPTYWNEYELEGYEPYKLLGVQVRAGETTEVPQLTLTPIEEAVQEPGGELSGSALLEIILDYPGLGSLMYTAVRSQDQFLVMGGFMMGACMLLLGNLLAELLLVWVDPRISYQ